MAAAGRAAGTHGNAADQQCFKIGPDGALYVADWYDGQINHYRNHEGQIDPKNGRIYRIKAKGTKPQFPGNLSQRSTKELVELLEHNNRWVRQTVLRLLGDRKDKSLIPDLKAMVRNHKDQTALEALWALNLSGGFDEEFAQESLKHPNPFVRLWTIRLMGDDKTVSSALGQQLVKLAQQEPHLEVRSQLACTARRLPAEFALPIIRQLMERKEDIEDIHIPLLIWWAIEAKAESDRESVVRLFADPKIWQLPMVETHILERVMRRYAQAGTRKDLLTCARLLELAPEKTHSQRLLSGFEKAVAGRSLAALPEELVRQLAKHGGGSLELRLRLGEKQALDEALKLIDDSKIDVKKRQGVVQILGEMKKAESIPLLLKLATDSRDISLQSSALMALQSFEEAKIGQQLVNTHDKMPAEPRSVAQRVLLSRSVWTRQWLQAVSAGQVQKKLIPLSLVRQMTFHDDVRIRELVQKIWGQVQGATTEEMQKQIVSLQKIIAQGTGSPYQGKKLFQATCGKCHTLFDHGGQIGPELTTYQRSDLKNMLLHNDNPSAEIRKGYENHLVITKDGRFLTGFLVDRDNQIVIIRNAEGQDSILERKEIEDMRSLSQSLMPEGLLKEMEQQQVRDLFAYLRSTQPLNE